MPPTVLVVDDDIGFRRLVTRLLRTRGFDVVAEACNGTEALAAVRVHRPDCVLLDVGLPDHDGHAIARTLAAGPRPSPRIVLTSSDPIDYGPAELAVCGVHAFVPKDRLADVDLHSLLSM
jgi:CheY-like chemotaxis protein